ncbi:YdeI/OmpD-associated family protein [Thiobacillus sp.]|uniref:YdeI/OmpD-associated family protein n=1 Tax=Thiobacillus sp. TaxID=924 RepID=UPI00286DA25F|nr:YdeI/OmpD-associated family protein [Thiobacillus sp.]
MPKQPALPPVWAPATFDVGRQNFVASIWANLAGDSGVITEIEDYFSLGCGRCERFASVDCSTRKWMGGLLALRKLCIDLKLVETVKWAHPCYMHKDRNIAIIGALRSDFRLIFFNAALMKDSEGVLERQGPNTRHPDIIRFTDNSQVAAMEGIIRSYLKEAMSYAEAGIKPQKDASEIELPYELAEALDSDPELAEAFHSLTPGRQRSYVINLSSAKKPETRISRIAAFRDRILAGKGALER